MQKSRFDYVCDPQKQKRRAPPIRNEHVPTLTLNMLEYVATVMKLRAGSCEIKIKYLKTIAKSTFFGMELYLT